MSTVLSHGSGGTSRAALDHLYQVLCLWQDLVLFQCPQHRLAELIGLVSSLETTLHATPVDERAVRSLFLAACETGLEWSMCCLLREIGQLTPSGLVEVGWLERALACWAAVSQRDTTMLFRDPASAGEASAGLSITSWVGLVDALRASTKEKSPSLDDRGATEDVLVRVLIALLSWENAVLADVSGPVGWSATDVRTSLDVVHRLQVVCEHCARHRFPLPPEVPSSVWPWQSVGGSPRRQASAPLSDGPQSITPLSPHGSAVLPAGPALAPREGEPPFSSTGSPMSDVCGEAAGSRRAARRSTLPPPGSSHDEGSHFATCKPAGHNADAFNTSAASENALLRERSPSSHSFGSRSTDSSHGHSRQAQATTTTAAPARTLTPPRSLPDDAVMRPLPPSAPSATVAATKKDETASHSTQTSRTHNDAHSNPPAKPVKRRGSKKPKRDSSKTDGCLSF